MKKCIVLTGGGTAGHIMPHLALLPELKKNFENIYYIGSNGMEKEIIKNVGIPFFEISATKFVRKISFKTFLLPFKLLKSIKQAKKILKDLKPNIVFSKGGYVSVPVAIAAKKLKIPVITHESDLSLGLANKIISHYANAVCTTFEKTTLQNKKCIFTGSPIRKEILQGNKQNVISQFDYDKTKPTILFMGGSLGAKALNDLIQNEISKLTQKYNILHLSGKDFKKIKAKNYYCLPFCNNIEDLFALCDVCVCRSGANTIMELASIQKPMILVPLPKGNSRGDQVENANEFEKNGLARVLPQDKLNYTNLIYEIQQTLQNKQKYIQNMQKLNLKNANKNILNIILQNCN